MQTVGLLGAAVRRCHRDWHVAVTPPVNVAGRVAHLALEMIAAVLTEDATVATPITRAFKQHQSFPNHIWLSPLIDLSERRNSGTRSHSSNSMRECLS